MPFVLAFYLPGWIKRPLAEQSTVAKKLVLHTQSWSLHRIVDSVLVFLRPVMSWNQHFNIHDNYSSRSAESKEKTMPPFHVFLSYFEKNFWDCFSTEKAKCFWEEKLLCVCCFASICNDLRHHVVIVSSGHFYIQIVCISLSPIVGLAL